ncbi:hypothetical protein MJO29_012145 [Puccinia striiformis f. sp. tritici]|nr:hypothetical protein MJO29_012145 [Puccinia striiformis f. sp. tritici]
MATNPFTLLHSQPYSMPSSNKQGANWFPAEDKQLAKSWLKITKDPITSTGQKKEDFFKQVAQAHNRYAAGAIERDWMQVSNQWVLHFSFFHCSYHILGNLLCDTKKEFCGQEGRQFIHELAWMVVKDSDKFKSLIQNRGGNNQQATTPITTLTPSTPAVTGESQTTTVVSLGSNTSYNRPPGVHTFKRAMEKEHFNAKKIQIMTDRSSNYCDQTLAMKQTNKICHHVAKAEVNQVNMEIMCKKPEDLPDNISRQFLQLQKKSILEDLQEEIKEKQQCVTEKAKKTGASLILYSQHTHPEESLPERSYKCSPSSNANQTQYSNANDDEDINQDANHSEYSNNNNNNNEEEFINPILR